MLAPLLVTLTFAVAGYAFRHADMTITTYISNSALVMQIGHAAIVSAATAAIFYTWALRRSDGRQI